MKLQESTEIDGIQCYAPDLMSEYSDYPNEGFEITEKVEEKSFWVRSRARILEREIRKILVNVHASVKFLEIGCGTGFFLRQLTSIKNIELTGSEIYINPLKYAKSKGSAVNFIQLNACDIPFESTYNIIGAFDVIEHIDDDVSVIKNVHKALVEGGYFILTVPQYMFMWSYIDDLVKHKRRYSRQDILNKLVTNNFEIIFVSSFVFTLFPLMLIQRIMDRKPKATINTASDFKERVDIPNWMNWMFNKIMKIDEFLIRLGISLPFGGSLLVVGRKIN